MPWRRVMPTPRSAEKCAASCLMLSAWQLRWQPPLKWLLILSSQWRRLALVSRASDSELKALTATARNLGATTNWSASDAADGMQYLAMAGFSANQTISAMPGMLSLASAGAIDLGSAADIASNILTGFNMKADEMGQLGDVLTNTFTTSNTNLQMLGETMKYVAPVAAATGVTAWSRPLPWPVSWAMLVFREARQVHRCGP